jgi:sulfite exporter TauE/SafE
MSLLPAVLALLVVGLIVAWLTAGIVLRVAGLAVATTGLLLALSRHPIGLLIAALGGLLWAAGHWHYALRHHTYKSPLARRLFLDLLPEQLDPTRHWAIPTDDDHYR